MTPRGKEDEMDKGSVTREAEFDTDCDAFDRICGNCAGQRMSEITEDDVREQAAIWARGGEPCSEGMIEAAIRGLRRYQEQEASDAE